MNSLYLLLGLILGYLISDFFAGREAGDKLQYSLRFKIRGYYIHIHHWLYYSLVLIGLALISFRNPLVYGLLIGTIVQGLHYRDRFIFWYKISDAGHIYTHHRKKDKRMSFKF